MSPFTKLLTSITDSTIWGESDGVRIVWVTMLAMADRHGRVEASLPGLAHRARVSLEVVQEALTKFLAPDPFSRTPDYEGRRVEEIPGGWRLLNHERIRNTRDEEGRREYMAEYMRGYRGQHGREGVPVNTINTVNTRKLSLAHTESREQRAETRSKERPNGRR